MISFKNLTTSAVLAVHLAMTVECVPIGQVDPRFSNLSSILQEALDFEENGLLPFDNYGEERRDKEGHHFRKTVHRHRNDDGVDIELETNE